MPSNRDKAILGLAGLGAVAAIGLVALVKPHIPQVVIGQGSTTFTKTVDLAQLFPAKGVAQGGAWAINNNAPGGLFSNKAEAFFIPTVDGLSNPSVPALRVDLDGPGVLQQPSEALGYASTPGAIFLDAIIPKSTNPNYFRRITTLQLVKRDGFANIPGLEGGSNDNRRFFIWGPQGIPLTGDAWFTGSGDLFSTPVLGLRSPSTGRNPNDAVEYLSFPITLDLTQLSNITLEIAFDCDNDLAVTAPSAYQETGLGQLLVEFTPVVKVSVLVTDDHGVGYGGQAVTLTSPKMQGGVSGVTAANGLVTFTKDAGGNLLIADSYMATATMKLSPGVSGFTKSVTADVTTDSTLNVFFAHPVPSFITPTGLFNAPTSFDGTASSAVEGTLVAFASVWSWGDGTSSVSEFLTTSHTFTATGTFLVTLRVTNSAGLTGSRTAPVTVPFHLIVNTIDELGTGYFGVPVVVKDSTGATVASATSPVGGVLFFTGLLTGTYTVQGTMANIPGVTGVSKTVTASLTGTDDATANLVWHHPIPDFVLLQTITKPGAGPTEASTFDGTISNPVEPGSFYAAVWDWGDSSPETTTDLTTTTLHTFLIPGIYTITLVTVNQAGLSSVLTRSISIASIDSRCVVNGVSSGATVTLTGVLKMLGDVNGNGTVDVVDFSIIIESFGASIGDPLYDIELDMNYDGKINIIDAGIVERFFGQVVSTPASVALNGQAIQIQVFIPGLGWINVSSQTTATGTDTLFGSVFTALGTWSVTFAKPAGATLVRAVFQGNIHMNASVSPQFSI